VSIMGTIDSMEARELDARETVIDDVDWVMTIFWERINDRDVTFATWRRRTDLEPLLAVEIPPTKVMDALEHPSLYFYGATEPIQT
jgi:hypothetical protein